MCTHTHCQGQFAGYISTVFYIYSLLLYEQLTTKLPASVNHVSKCPVPGVPGCAVEIQMSQMQTQVVSYIFL